MNHTGSGFTVQHHFRFVAVVMCLLVAAPSIGVADAPPSCILEAETRVRTRDWVRLSTKDGRQAEGYLAEIDREQSTVSLAPTKDLQGNIERFSGSSLTQIQYRKAGKLKPGFMLLGLAGGAMVGMSIAAASDGSGQFENLAAVVGGVIGGAGGLLIGTFVPMAIPSMRTIKCE